MEQKQELQEKIGHYDRGAVKSLISQGVLKTITDETEKNAICRDLIMELKDLSIVELMIKEDHLTLTPAMFDLNTNYHGRELINKILAKYLKNFDLNDSDVCEWIFCAACASGNFNVAKKMLQHDHGYQNLDKVAGAGVDFYELAMQVKHENIPNDTVVRLFVESAKQPGGETYLKMLLKHGFDLSTCTIDGLTAYQILEKAVQEKPKNKKAINELHRNQEAFMTLKRVLKEQAEKEGKKEIRRQSAKNGHRTVMAGILVAIAVVVVILAAVKVHSGSSDSAATETSALSETVAE